MLQKVRRYFWPVLKHIIIGIIWCMILVLALLAATKPPRVVRSLGAFYLLNWVEFPHQPSLSEQHRSVVFRQSGIVLTFRHWAGRCEPSVVATELVDAMRSRGYIKRDEASVGTDTTPARAFLFTKENGGHFCFLVRISIVKDDDRTTATIVDSVYKIFSETAYEGQKVFEEELAKAAIM